MIGPVRFRIGHTIDRIARLIEQAQKPPDPKCPFGTGAGHRIIEFFRQPQFVKQSAEPSADGKVAAHFFAVKEKVFDHRFGQRGQHDRQRRLGLLFGQDIFGTFANNKQAAHNRNRNWNRVERNWHQIRPNKSSSCILRF